MSVWDELKKAGGCAGGVTIYFNAKEAAWVANHVPGMARKSRELSENTRRRFKQLFPKLDLGRVRFSVNSTLPGNWFTSADSIDAMTFGYHIYFKGSDIQKTYENYLLLIHELVHVNQVRHYEDSETVFACEYGKGYLEGGDYAANPLEREAYNFVARLPFDPSFYLGFHSDVAKALGQNSFPAFCHWFDHGIQEGRISSMGFDVTYYLGHYADLQATFGNDHAAAIRHWLKFGLMEGRRASPAFDGMYYLAQHPDLQSALGKKDYPAALQHWYTYGLDEGRRSAPDFDPKFYLGKYADLQNVFGATNYRAATFHWLKYGIKEGRQGVQAKTLFTRPDGFSVEPVKVTVPVQGRKVRTSKEP